MAWCVEAVRAEQPLAARRERSQEYVSSTDAVLEEVLRRRIEQAEGRERAEEVDWVDAVRDRDVGEQEPFV